MALDAYAPCPCGSGKKIKFCKCKDSLPEMDKISRMIGGEQYVAALESINSQLKLTPNEPWLLAMKCEVAFRLGEMESLEETSAKFIRLQPDNPLAKLNRALVAIVRGAIDEAASLYLQALATGRAEAGTIMLSVASNLMQMLGQTGAVASAMLLLEMSADRVEGADEVFGQIQNSLVSQHGVSVLQRESIPLLAEAEGTAFSERFREAMAMYHSADVVHAKNKLEGIQREFGPNLPTSLAMLHCRLCLIDLDGAAELCLKIAADTSVALEQRTYFYALAVELNPVKSGMAEQLHIVVREIEDAVRVETALMATGHCRLTKDVENSFVHQVMNEEVAPKAVYLIEYQHSDLTLEGATPRTAVGMVGIYGRQTDKPPRAVVIRTHQLIKPFDALVDQTLEAAEITAAPQLSEQSLPTPIANSVFSPWALDKVPESAANSADFGEQFTSRIRGKMIDLFMDIAPKAFNGKTLAEAAKDPAYEVDVRGLLLQTVTSPNVMLDHQSYLQWHERLGLTPFKLSPNVDGFDFCGGAYYHWADYEAVDLRTLVGLARSALIRQHGSIYVTLRDTLKSRSGDEEIDQTNLDLLIAQFELATARTTGERLARLESMYNMLRQHNIPAGQIGIMWFQELAGSGDRVNAPQVLDRVIKENQKDPAVLQFVYALQAQMQQMQRGGGGGPNAGMVGGMGGAPMGQPAPSPAAEQSGLWTPESGNQAAASKGESGGSGLWLPG